MSKKRILIVDDDADARLALNVRLRANGYEIFNAIDGVSAMSEARKCTPDLVILDLGLPAGDGYAVMDRFQNHPQLAGTPVVVSGRDFRVHRNRAIRSGAKTFLQKPVDSDLLMRVVHRIFGDQADVYAQ